MLRSLVLLAAGTAFCMGAASPQVAAQSGATTEETIVLKRSTDQPQTTIEIQNGEVRVNGEKVATFSGPEAKTLHKKIIIDGGDDAPQAFTPDRPSVIRKTVLGVLTETAQTGNGARVKRVIESSAAEEAALRVGDRIFRVDNKTINSSEDLVSLIGGHKPGDKVTIAYERDGKNRTATATLKAADPQTTVIPSNPFGGGGGMGGDDAEIPNGMLRSFPFGNFDFRDMMESSDRPKLGMSVEDRDKGDGVRISSITEGSAAEKAGLKEGDVITHIEGEPLQSVDDLQRRVRLTDAGETLALRYERGGKSLKADVTLPKAIKRREL